MMPAPHILEQAMAAFGLAGASVQPVQDLVNRTFRVTHGQRDLLLRLHDPTRHDQAAIESELAWLRALATETPLRLQSPQPATDGCYVARLEGGAVLASLLTWLPGEIRPQNRRTPDDFVHIGRMLATLHEHGSRWTPPAGFARGVLSSDGLRRTLADTDLPLGGVTAVTHAFDVAAAAEAALGRSPAVFGLVHGDASFGNILFTDDGAALIDFDDCGFGHHAGDLGVVLAGAWSRPDYDACRTALLAGYGRAADELAEVLPAFMARRAAALIIESSDPRDRRGQLQRMNEYLQRGTQPCHAKSP